MLLPRKRFTLHFPLSASLSQAPNKSQMQKLFINTKVLITIICQTGILHHISICNTMCCGMQYEYMMCICLFGSNVVRRVGTSISLSNFEVGANKKMKQEKGINSCSFLSFYNHNITYYHSNWSKTKSSYHKIKHPHTPPKKEGKIANASKTNTFNI